MAMQKSERSGFAININGAFRPSRDLEAPAYEAANVLKAKNPGETVTIIKPDGGVVRILRGRPDGLERGNGAATSTVRARSRSN